MTNSLNLPKSSQLIEVILQALKDLGDSATSKEIDARAIALLGLSAEQFALKHSDVGRYLMKGCRIVFWQQPKARCLPGQIIKGAPASNA